LQKIPRPDREELPALYEELDKMAHRIGMALIESRFFSKKTKVIRFDKMTLDDIYELIMGVLMI